MKKFLYTLLQGYGLVLSASLMLFGFANMHAVSDLLQSALFIPMVLYFYAKTFKRIPFSAIFRKKRDLVQSDISKSWFYRILAVYSLLFIAIFTFALLMNVRSVTDGLYIAIISPLTAYFVVTVTQCIKNKLHHKQNLITNKEIDLVQIHQNGDNESQPIKEKDRRNFFRVITSAGIGGLVLYLIFPQRAEAAFFGSMPGPGTISIKDTSGAKIDPAIKSPTDGYAVANIDSTAYPYYYGFVNKDAAWYIMRENPENTFTYSKGSSDFSTNWTNRASLTYASFDVTF